MMRRTLLTTAVVLITGAFAPAIPAGASGDPATFINNLGHQLQMVTSNTSPEQRLAGFASCSARTSTFPASAALFSADIGGLSPRHSSRNSLGCSRITSCSPIVTACRSSPTAATSPR